MELYDYLHKTKKLTQHFVRNAVLDYCSVQYVICRSRVEHFLHITPAEPTRSSCAYLTPRAIRRESLAWGP